MINPDQLLFYSRDANDIGIFGVHALPNNFEGNNGYLPTHNRYVDGVFGGYIAILNRIIQRELVRPLHNIRCNNI